MPSTSFSHILKALALALAFAGATGARADGITVFAAASLRDALTEAAAGFDAETGHHTTLAFAGSSALARQIGFGAPADLFISASPDWMEWLAERNLIDPATRTDIAGNALVLIAHGHGLRPLAPDFDLAALLGAGRLATALTDAVPAGIYARQALTRLGLWNSVADKLAQSDNVRAALALVALGEAPYGIVYASDAQAEPNVTAIFTFPPDSHDAIRYPAALIAGQSAPAARDLLSYLQSDDAAAIFIRHGFTRPGDAK